MPLYLETILGMWEVWDFHERFSSIRMPRNLVESTFSIFLSSISIFFLNLNQAYYCVYF